MSYQIVVYILPETLVFRNFGRSVVGLGDWSWAFLGIGKIHPTRLTTLDALEYHF
jgi:hypothetical protein